LYWPASFYTTGSFISFTTYAPSLFLLLLLPAEQLHRSAECCSFCSPPVWASLVHSFISSRKIKLHLLSYFICAPLCYPCLLFLSICKKKMISLINYSVFCPLRMLPVLSILAGKTTEKSWTARTREENKANIFYSKALKQSSQEKNIYLPDLKVKICYRKHSLLYKDELLYAAVEESWNFGQKTVLFTLWDLSVSK